jgi:2-C-methyl-D-erythritol 2,4-cyclodiphosphate synthase
VANNQVDYRIGIGEDSHRTGPGGPLRLGGIDIPHDAHTLGHSDADVLLHAVTDALFGAAGLPDIGEQFPDGSEAHRGQDSAVLLASACEQVAREGWRIVNLDCVIAAEKPKISPHKPRIRERLAEILGVQQSLVNVKAKTGEGVGPVGRGELIEARCIVLLTNNTPEH